MSLARLRFRSREWLNRGLAPLGLRLDSLTGTRAEQRRLAALVAGGWFERPAFPVLPAFLECDPAPVLDAVARYPQRLEDFSEASRNATGYAYDNPYFGSPDAEVLYALLRRFEPATVLEVGSGHSTRVIRQAIDDGGWGARLISVDPAPRAEVAALVDEQHRVRIESGPGAALAERIGPGDVLFVDSSHEVRTANDVVVVYLDLLPRLASGAIVHVHDVFLPWDYPREWVVEQGWPWAEQYLVQALLWGTRDLEVIWPGHYLQRTLEGFARHFPHARRGRAQSLWLRRR